MTGRRRVAPGGATLACAALLRAAAGSAAAGLAEAPCSASGGQAGDDGVAVLARTLLLQTHLEQRPAAAEHSSPETRVLNENVREYKQSPATDPHLSEDTDSKQMWRALVGTVSDGSKVRAVARLSKDLQKDVLAYWSTNEQLLKLGLAAVAVFTVPALLLEQYGFLMVLYVASIVSIGLLTTGLQEPIGEEDAETRQSIEMATQTLGWLVATVLSTGLFAARWLFHRLHGNKGPRPLSGHEVGAMVASGLVAAMTGMAVVLDGPSEIDGTTCGVVREAAILWMPVLWRYQFEIDLGLRRLNSICIILAGLLFNRCLGVIAPAPFSSTVWVFILVLTNAFNMIVGEAALKRGRDADINAQNAVACGTCVVTMLGYMAMFHSSYLPSLASLPVFNGGLFTKLIVVMHVVVVLIQSRLLKYCDAISTMVARVLVGPSLVVCMRLVSDRLVVDHGVGLASVVVTGGCLCWFWNGSSLYRGSAFGHLEKGLEHAPAGRLLQGAPAGPVLFGGAPDAWQGHREFLPKVCGNSAAAECRLQLQPHMPIEDGCESDEDDDWWWQTEPPELTARTPRAAEAAYVLMAHVEELARRQSMSVGASRAPEDTTSTKDTSDQSRQTTHESPTDEPPRPDGRAA